MLYLDLFDSVGARLEGPLLLSPEDAAAKISRNLHAAFGSGAAILADAASNIGIEIDASRPELQPSCGEPRGARTSSQRNLADFAPALSPPPGRKAAKRKRRGASLMQTTPDNNSIALRVATLDDASELSQLHARCFPRGWDEASIGAFIADPACVVFIASAGEDKHVSRFLDRAGRLRRGRNLDLGRRPGAPPPGCCPSASGRHNCEASGSRESPSFSSRSNRATRPRKAFIAALAPNLSAAARPIMSMAPMPPSSALPFDAGTADDAA